MLNNSASSLNIRLILTNNDRILISVSGRNTTPTPVNIIVLLIAFVSLLYKMRIIACIKDEIAKKLYL